MDTVRNTDIDVVHPESLPLENRAALLSVVILTYNEEKNLEACLRSLRGLARECFVVDSGSTDGTGPIAESLGVEVVHHVFEGHARQWNWALRNLPLSFEWALCLDADQRLTPELREEIRLVLESPPAEVDGFYMKRRQVFLGRWIRHGAYYPKYCLKLLRHRSAWSDEREYLDFRFYVKGHVAYLRHDVIEDNRKDYDLSVWTHKHLSFVMKQSLEEFHRQNGKVRGFAIRPELLGNPDQRTLWQKCVWYRLPLYFRPFLYFAYRYFLRLGFLDGKEGFVFHFLHAFWYRLMVDTQLDRLRREVQKS
jgi:glycosyltransferase involved in cell wall biosynthesis